MSFDEKTRKLLAKTVAACRGKLTEDVTDQLRGLFGMHPDGTVLPLDKLTHLSANQAAAARQLRDLLFHYVEGRGQYAESRDQKAGSESSPFLARCLQPAALRAAYERIILEISFTVLNRLSALRLCEERGLVVECVRKGPASAGFQMFERISGGALGSRYDTYRVFLECLFDELALDLGVLFDRTTPQSAVFPTERCTEDVLSELNKPELAHLWTEDETIGWIYQYFNPPEERKAMREASQAPRNSRELAVRNQFFTPRYVVEFLADNTLGRIWYEMRKGDTTLKEECRYLVRRPNEVFLKPGEVVSTEQQAVGSEELTSEDLLKQPLYTEHRPKKDPRDIRVLDPACGSGHFLLYAFNLLEQIYWEAWEEQNTVGSGQWAGGEGDDNEGEVRFDQNSLELALKEIGYDYSQSDYRRLVTAHSSRDAFLKAVPKMIIEYNLHGIDIDPRAVQIAALALWLRAQKSWKNLGIKASDRPQIERSNIVTAEPMPGEEDMRREFTAALKPRMLGQLVDVVFDKMRLAGEAGSLLKIEEEMKVAVAEAKKEWDSESRAEQQELFAEMRKQKATQQPLFDVSSITDERFWGQAEEHILAALKGYAEHVENGHSVRRRLFAEDTARGFAFIDLCRKKYDVVLMNPPFGDASIPSKAYVEDLYGDTKGDVYKTFVECFQDRILPGGLLGMISSRTGFFLANSTDWREKVVMRLYRPLLLADFGYGVLDAMVETAAYVLRTLREEERQGLTLSLAPDLLNVETDRNHCFSIPKYVKARGGNLKRHQAEQELNWLITSGCIREVRDASYRKFRNTLSPRHRSSEKRAYPLPHLICFRLVGDSDKGDALLRLITDQSCHDVFVVRPDTFRLVPNHPFAYWVSDSVRRLFKTLSRIESNDRTVKQGLATANDFRFVRAWWEIPAGRIAGSHRVSPGERWRMFAKGGAYSQFYADIHLLVNWGMDGAEICNFVNLTTGKTHSRPQNTDYYFLRGLTWPRRTTSGLSVRALPAGCIFSDKGPSAFVAGDNCVTLLSLMAVMNSRPFEFMVSLQLAVADAAARSYEVGIIQRTPMIDPSNTLNARLATAARQAWFLTRTLDTSVLTSHAFTLPAILQVKAVSLAERAKAFLLHVEETRKALDTIQTEIDAACFDLYGLDSSDRVRATNGASIEMENEPTEHAKNEEIEENMAVGDHAPALTSTFLDWLIGVAFGRFDLRWALDLWTAAKEPNPFDPLPVCSPGMLVGPDGLPAESGRIVSEEWLRARPDESTLPDEGGIKSPTIVDSDYPLRITWDGLLGDDPGISGAQPNRDDIIRRVREVLDVLWHDRAYEIEEEACEILGVSDLRDYFRRPTGFFQDHLKRYSKSRRKAPIYWPLSTASGSYTIWLYYHRLTDQTLYTAVNKYVEPKIADVQKAVSSMQHAVEAGEKGNSRDLPAAYSQLPFAQLRSQWEDARAFLNELQEFREELLRIAALPYKPNLNDGVIINAAPLYKLFRFRSWAKDAEACWKKLEKGDYDWSHLAYTVWPKRVWEVCRHDRSIAIAHGLEDLCGVTARKAKKDARNKRKPNRMTM